MSGLEEELDARVSELIDRGLDAYGSGDLDGAMGAWRHALVLDENNQSAINYVAYVKRYFNMTDEQAVASNPFADAAVELEIPFGLLTVSPASFEAVDDYESYEFEVTHHPDTSDEPIRDFSEDDPTNARALGIVDIDEGWSLEFDMNMMSGGPSFETRIDRPIIDDTDPRAIEPRAFADTSDEYELQYSVHDDTALDTNDVASVPVEPESIETEMDNPSSEVMTMFPPPDSRDPIDLWDGDEPDQNEVPEVIELVAEPSSPIELEDDYNYEHGAEFKLDLSEPTDSSGEVTVSSGEVTVQISPLELSEALTALELDEPLPTSEAEFPSQPYASVNVLDGELELPEPVSISDVQISFREPTAANIIEIEPMGGAELDLQLAELEREMTTATAARDWAEHRTANDSPPSSEAFADASLSGTGSFSGKAATLEKAAPPPLAPLQPRRPRYSSSPNENAEASVRRRTRKSIPPEDGGLDGTQMQVLAAVDRHAPFDEQTEERIRRRIHGLIEFAEIKCGAKEFQLAAVAADLALEEEPDSALGQKLIHEQSELLISIFRRFLGTMSGVVAVALPLHELASRELDHRTAFLLSRVDGTLSIEDILDVSGMPRLEAYRYLAHLVLEGVLEVREMR